MNPRMLREAAADYIEAARWYDERRTGLGFEFLDEVTRALENITEDPSRYPVAETADTSAHDIRRCGMRRFPYSIIFEIRSDEMLVVAIAHASRNPDFWISRLDD